MTNKILPEAAVSDFSCSLPGFPHNPPAGVGRASGSMTRASAPRLLVSLKDRETAVQCVVTERHLGS